MAKLPPPPVKGRPAPKKGKDKLSAAIKSAMDKQGAKGC